MVEVLQSYEAYYGLDILFITDLPRVLIQMPNGVVRISEMLKGTIILGICCEQGRSLRNKDFYKQAKSINGVVILEG